MGNSLIPLCWVSLCVGQPTLIINVCFFSYYYLLTVSLVCLVFLALWEPSPWIWNNMCVDGAVVEQVKLPPAIARSHMDIIWIPGTFSLPPFHHCPTPTQGQTEKAKYLYCLLSQTRFLSYTQLTLALPKPVASSQHSWSYPCFFPTMKFSNLLFLPFSWPMTMTAEVVSTCSHSGGLLCFFPAEWVIALKFPLYLLPANAQRENISVMQRLFLWWWALFP